MHAVTPQTRQAIAWLLFVLLPLALTGQQGPAISPAAELPSIGPPFVEPLASWLFALAGAAALFPAILYVLGDRASPFPVLPLVGLFYALFFALPPFVIDRHWWTAGQGTGELARGIVFDRLTTATAAVVLTGVAGLLAGYWATSKLLPQPAPLALEITNRDRMRVILWTIVAAYLVFLYVPSLRHNATLAQAMSPLGYLATGMLFFEWSKRRISRASGVVLLTAIGLMIVSHVSDGLLTPVILLALFLATIHVAATRRIVVAASALAVCVAAAFPLFKSGDDQSAALIMRRVALVAMLQRTVDLTPSTIPYWRGESLRNLATNPIPRALWSGKPREEMGQTFGHRYLLLSDDDTRTSMNLPWLVELFINFGIAGVAVGMILAGALLAALERAFLRGEGLGMIAAWSLIFPLTYQASNISLMLGGLLTQAALMLATVALVSVTCRGEPANPYDWQAARAWWPRKIGGKLVWLRRIEFRRDYYSAGIFRRIPTRVRWTLGAVGVATLAGTGLALMMLLFWLVSAG